MDMLDLDALIRECAADDPVMPLTPTHYKGPGAQDRARAEGKYVLQIGPRRGGGYFIGFKSHEQRCEAAVRLGELGHDVNERVDGSKPCRPFIDFDNAASDGPLGQLCTDEDIGLVCSAVRDELTAAGVDGNIDSFGYNTPDKRSRHIIVTDVYVTNGAAVRQFAEAVQARLPERLGRFVDCIGNNKSFGLRLPGCPKDGDTSRTLKPICGGLSGLFLQDDAPLPVCDYWDVAACDATPSPARDFGNSATNVETLVQLVVKDFPHFERIELVADRHPYIVAQFSRVYPHHCNSCDRVHDSYGAYICVGDDGAAYLRCYRAENGSKVLASAGARAMDEELPPDGYDRLETATIVNCKYNDEGILDDGISDMHIGSAWGTGKSHFNRLLIENLLRINPHAKILCLSARKSLSAQMCADLGATSYTSIKGILDTKRYPVSVWQLESLKRVDCASVFDLIIVDELNSLIGHAYQRSENASARAGISTMRLLLKNAVRVVVSDNDLTEAHVAAMQSLRHGKQTAVYRNEYQPWKGVTAQMHEGHKQAEELERNLFKRLDTQYAARLAGEPWHGTVVAAHSRKTANRLNEEMRRRYGSDLVKLYTSESDDHTKKADFSNAALAWDGKLCVMYTGTVSVGVSCNIEHFDTVYAFFVGNNASTATSAQMLFRCRQVKSIHASFVGLRTYGLPLGRDALMNWATAAQNRGTIPDELRHDRCPTIDSPTACVPAALSEVCNRFEGQLWINAMLESTRSKADFVRRLTRILTNAGIDVQSTKCEPVEAVAPTPASGEDLGMTREELMVAEAPAAVERLGDSIDNERDRTAGEKAGDRIVQVCATYGIDARIVSPEWVAAYEPLVEKYDRLARIIDGTTRDGPELSITSQAEGCELAVKTLAALGLDPNTLVSGTVVPIDQVKDAAELMGPYINKNCLRVLDEPSGPRRAKTMGSFKSQRGTLNVPLSYIGLQMEPTYRTKRDEAKKNNPIGIKLSWVWDCIDIEPRPAHPEGAK